MTLIATTPRDGPIRHRLEKIGFFNAPAAPRIETGLNGMAHRACIPLGEIDRKA